MKQKEFFLNEFLKRTQTPSVKDAFVAGYDMAYKQVIQEAYSLMSNDIDKENKDCDWVNDSLR